MLYSLIYSKFSRRKPERLYTIFECIVVANIGVRTGQSVRVWTADDPASFFCNFLLVTNVKYSAAPEWADRLNFGATNIRLRSGNGKYRKIYEQWCA